MGSVYPGIPAGKHLRVNDGSGSTGTGAGGTYYPGGFGHESIFNGFIQAYPRVPKGNVLLYQTVLITENFYHMFNYSYTLTPWRCDLNNSDIA
ncbi:hypothetical protein EW146_g10500 [Bondarzewia mesenterica]|uniref:Uncharacterized protein n=1 Tax=Bondarzewia mesenterica TaxID=1095465 RepID=A0A4S4KWZ5_9AGAM|nr:hypothetical protein EW146_g10500 [Bondarzewia mesenterica]